MLGIHHLGQHAQRRQAVAQGIGIGQLRWWLRLHPVRQRLAALHAQQQAQQLIQPLGHGAGAQAGHVVAALGLLQQGFHQPLLALGFGAGWAHGLKHHIGQGTGLQLEGLAAQSLETQHITGLGQHDQHPAMVFGLIQPDHARHHPPQPALLASLEQGVPLGQRQASGWGRDGGCGDIHHRQR